MWRGLCLAALVLVTGCGGGAETGGGGVEAASPAGAAAPAAGAAIDITAVKPFVLEKDASFQALIDAAPVWAQVEARGDAAARKGALGEVILQVLKRDGVSKFPKATEFQVKLVRVTEYDSYNRPMFATGKVLCEGKLTAAAIPADASADAVAKAAPATAALVWNDANLK